jgi:hypothetical protein
MRKIVAALMLGGMVLSGMVGLRYMGSVPSHVGLTGSMQEAAAFTLDRKNYASEKLGASAGPASGPAAGNTQKYEKIATIGLATDRFENHRVELSRLVEGAGAQVQLERLQGLAGRRVLNLGIGVPPERFDEFVAAARRLGAETGLTIVKNDKTNDYLKLRARRASLEKTRQQLDALQAAGGSVDERLKVQNQLSDLEEKIQEMGVSLGEFDATNELCTVKITIAERQVAVRPSEAQRWQRAIAGALPDFALLTFGLTAIVGMIWMAAGIFAFGRRLAGERGAT